MSPKKNVKNLAEPEFGRTKKIYIWEHGNLYSKCHEIRINPNHLRTWNAILSYLTTIINPVFGAIRKLVSIKTRKCIICFKDLENNGRYIAVGVVKPLRFTANRFKTDSEMEMEAMSKKMIKRFYSGEIGETELKFLCETQKRKLTIIFLLVNGIPCQSPTKLVLTSTDFLAWDIILSYLEKMLDVPDGVQHLCTIYGDIILDPTELQHGYVYVVLPHNQKFEPMDYMKFFSEWNETSNKKGLLLSIRPASKKYSRTRSFKPIKKRELTLDEKQSYTIPSAGDGVGVHGDDDQVGQGNMQEKHQRSSSPETEDKVIDTQTTYNIQEDTVVIGSKVYILTNVAEYNRQQVCSSNVEGKDVTTSMSLGKLSEIHTQTKTSITVKDTDKSPENYEKVTQTSVVYLKSVNNTDKSVRIDEENLMLKTEQDSKVLNQSLVNEENLVGVGNKQSGNISKPVGSTKKSEQNMENDIEYMSITVIVGKTSRILDKSEANENFVNLTLNKTYETRTYCSNIAVSGGPSEKLGVIKKIVNDVVIDTYEKSMQSENNNLEKNCNITPLPVLKSEVKNVITNTGTGTKKERISSPTNVTNDITRTKDKINKKSMILQDKQTVTVKETENINRAVGTTVDENMYNQHLDEPGSKGNPVNKYNMYPGHRLKTPLYIKNKTCINFCDFLTTKRKETCEDIKVIYHDKHSCSRAKADRLCGMTPKFKGYNCCLCTRPPVYHIGVNKDYSVNTTNNTDKPDSKCILSTSVPTQTENRILTDPNIYGSSTVGKPVQDSMSLDSISDENNESVSITVNVNKVNTVEQHREINDKQKLKTADTKNAIKRNEVYSSKIMVDGDFSEKVEIVKDLINEILGEVFDRVLLNNGEFIKHRVEPITEKSNIQSNFDDQKYENISNKNNNSIRQNETVQNSVNILPKTSFKEINARQNNENFLKKCQKSKCSKYVPVIKICNVRSYKSRKGAYIRTCDNNTPSICARGEQEFSCCICSKYISNLKDKSNNKGTDVLNEEDFEINSRKSKATQSADDKLITNEKSVPINRNNKEIEEIISRNMKNKRAISNFKYTEGETDEDCSCEGSSCESEISIDSIEDSSCCICVCPLRTS